MSKVVTRRQGRKVRVMKVRVALLLKEVKDSILKRMMWIIVIIL